MSSKYADLWNQDEKQRKSQQQQQQQPKAVKASYADKWNEGAATPAKRNDSSGGNLATSFLKWLYHPDPVETPISAADRQTMMRTNTGHAQDPVVLPGKQTSAQIRAQQLARQRRNAQEVAQMSPGEVQPSPVKPVYPNGTIGPVKGRTPMELANRSELEKWQDRAHEVQSFIGDPGLYIKNAVDKPIQQTKTVISQLAGDVGKGLTLGALDLDQGKLLGQKVLPTNAEMLQSSGVSQDVANREMTGFKIGDIVPELKGTFFDWDIHPAEWATMGPAVGAASRGLSKITEPVGKFLFSKAPVVLKPLIPTLTRIFNAGLTGSAINTASGLLQGQSAKSIPANAASGFGVGAAFGLVGEGLNTIANAPVAYRANLYKQAVDKMAQWAYGEGKFNSYDEAFQAADNVLSREINSRGGLGNLRPKDLKGFNQAVETMLKKQNRPGVPGDTPRMVDQAIVDSLNSSATNVNQPGIVPKQSQNGAVPVKPMQTSVPVRQPINQPHFPGAPGMFTPIAQPANNMNRQPVRPVQETQTNVPQVQTPPVNVNPVAGQKNGQTKQPWEMTQNEYILSLFSDPENYTDADIENIVHQQNRINHQEILQKEGTDDVQVIIKRWAQKYGIKTPIETTTRDIGSEGLTHTDWKDGKPVKYGINVSKVEPDERLGILRHEFEHVLDQERYGKKAVDSTGGTGRLRGEAYHHHFYKQFDIIRPHRQAVKQALREGKTVPQEVLDEYPDLQQKYNSQVKPSAKSGSYQPGEMVVDVKDRVWKVTGNDGTLLTVENDQGTKAQLGKGAIKGRVSELQTPVHEQPKQPERIIPKTLDELKEALVKINQGRVTGEQTDALMELIKGVAQYKGESPDQYVSNRIAGVEQGGKLSKEALLQKIIQAISSAGTSVRQVPGTFSHGYLDKPGTVNFDLGGGAYDEGTNFLKEKGITNLVYDPYNRSEEHNANVLAQVAKKAPDTVTINNVLNVIKEREVREYIIKQAADVVKQEGKAYFQIWPGDSSRRGRISKFKDGEPSQWQNNSTAKYYLPEVKRYFGNATVVKKDGIDVIVAENPFKNHEAAAWKSNPDTDVGAAKYQSIRPKGEIGKKVMQEHYVHKSALNLISSDKQELVAKAKKYLPADFDYDILKINTKNQTVSFIQSPDWDTSNEPTVEDSFGVNVANGTTKLTKGRTTNKQIYHHKWQFVADDYKGFNVEASKRRSEQWENSGLVYDKNKIGNMDYWQERVNSKLSKNTLAKTQDGEVKAAVEFDKNGKAIIHAFQSSNVADMAHELAHIFRRDLNETDAKIAAAWAGAKNGNWDRNAEEKFAEGFEKYLSDGAAPNSRLKAIFEKFKEWLISIYKHIKDKLNVEISDEIKGVFDRLVSGSSDTQLSDLEKTVKVGKPARPDRVVTEPTFKYISDFGKRIDSGDVTAQEVKNQHQFMLDHETAIKQSILDYINSSDKYKRKRADTKTKLVDDTFDRELESLVYAGRDSLSYEIMTGDYKQNRRTGIKKAVDGLTDEAIQKKSAAKKQRREVIEKSISNPETLEEFRRFVSVKGESALSPEQRKQYDELLAEAAKSRKKQDTTVAKVNTNVDMKLVEAKHTKTGEPLFVVTMGERVAPEVYRDLNTKAKQLGGHYSSFRGQGAVPGFQFKSQEAAEQFMALREGDVSAADIKAEHQAEAKNKTAQKLTDLADRMTENANEELNRDRKTNTAKRAGEAAYAEDRARKESALADTIRNVAQAIESGKAKHLDRVTARTHVELLERLLYDARNEAVKKEDGDRKREPQESDIDGMDYSYPSSRADQLNSMANDFSAKKFPMYAARLRKFAARVGGNEMVEFKTASEIKAVKSIMAKAKTLGITAPWYLDESTENYDRLQTMGIESLPQLRAALREYLQYRGKKAEVDPVKAMERELVGTKIPGYFPTPKPIVDRMIDEAGIEPGMTVLEPSAGKGNIADAVREAGVDPDVIEVNGTLRNVLEAKKHNVVADDFTQYDGKKYDRIVMNPPFENGQDIEHVQRAYEMLNPGGRVVAIMSEGPFYRNDKKAAAFREWLDEVGGTSEKLPEGAFKDSERSTGVNTRLVVIGKPGDQHSIEQNIRDGKEAMDKVIAEKTDVINAMYRPEVGDISFYWGKPGKPEKQYKDGNGISHIIARRNLEGKNGEAIVRQMVEVIARGKVSDQYGPVGGERVNVEYNGHTAVLSLYHFKDRATWLLTGFDNNKTPVESGENVDSSRPTPNGLYYTRPNGGAGESDNIISHSGENVKINKKQTPPGIAGVVRKDRTTPPESGVRESSITPNLKDGNKDFSKIEAAVKEAGFKNIEEATLAFRAAENGLTWFKESNPDIENPAKEYVRLKNQVSNLPEEQKSKLKLNLQMFSKKDNRVSIDDRNYEMVGKRDVRAYQQLHPELADYIQGEAIRIIGEMADVVKGQKFVTQNIYSGGEGETVTHQTKLSSDTINRIQESTGATYGEIAESLEAVAKGTSKINTALAKKIELIIDDNLTNGVTDIRGKEIESDQGYIWAKNNVKPVTDTELYDSKQIEKLKVKYEERLKKMTGRQKARFLLNLGQLKSKHGATVKRVKYQETWRRLLAERDVKNAGNNQMAEEAKKYQDKLTVAEWEGKEKLKQSEAKGRERLAKFKGEIQARKERAKYRGELQKLWKQKDDADVKRQKLEAERLTKAEEKAESVAKGKGRSRIAFIRELGSFKQTVVNEVKKQLGYDKPLIKLSLEELQNVSVEMRKRLKFKFERGYKVPAETRERLRLKSEPKTLPSEADYEAVSNIDIKDNFRENISRSFEKTKHGASKILTPISTRLENISPSLKHAMRKMEFNLGQSTRKDHSILAEYLKPVRKMSKKDWAQLDYAMKNGDIDKINSLNQKYHLEAEYQKIHAMFDDIHKRMNEVGIKVGYEKDYWPRIIKDVRGFLEYVSGQDYWSILETGIKNKEMELGRQLQPEEKAALINTLIRGFKGGQISLSLPGAAKERTIDLISPELNKFYYDSATAAVKYVESMNEAIAVQKFFGKGTSTDQFSNIADSIGNYTADLLAKGEVNAGQEIELRQILNARFNPRGTHGFVGVYKNLSYIDAMGSPLNAITQLGDMAWSIYRGGLTHTAKNALLAVFGKSKLTREDLGAEAHRIAQEFSDASKTAKALDKIFQVIGLNAMDRLGKEALINTSVDKYRNLASKNNPGFVQKLNTIFGGEAQQVINDLNAGVMSDNVKYLIFNDLLDFHPISLSEMPEAYLTAGNGRIFYALKSYTLKQFDIFRREAFREMARGNWMKGIGNLLRLAIVVMICNGAADEIKDLLMNRKSDLSDVVIDQIANLAGFSRYTLDSMKREGPVQSVVKQIQPSFGFLTNLWKDIIAANKDPEENLRIDKLRSVKSIPLVGKFYYYWFGKGSNSKDSRHSTASPLERLKQEKSALEAKLKEAKKSKTQLNEEDLERLHVLRFYSGKISRCNKIIDNIKAMPQEEAAACFKTNQPKKAKDEEINLIKGEINEITNEALKAVQ